MSDGSNAWEEAVSWLREQPGQESVVRAAYFDDPALAAAVRFWRSEEWSAVRTYLPSLPATALDVGAGRGIASYALARDGYDVTALEPNPSALIGSAAIRSISKEAGLTINIVESMTETMPFPDASFDVIYARAVLHHIENLDQAMAEFARVLKPGGVLIASRDHVINHARDLPVFLAAHSLHHRYGGENAYPVIHYADAIKSSGLKIDRVLAPLKSPINYSPVTSDRLGVEIAARLPSRSLRMLVEHAMRIPFLRSAFIAVVAAVDNRPGRHYSFVAHKV